MIGLYWDLFMNTVRRLQVRRARNVNVVVGTSGNTFQQPVSVRVDVS
jgi:hypothetical protein